WSRAWRPTSASTTRSVPISPWAIGLRPRSIEPGPAESEGGTPGAIPDRPRVRVLRFDHPGRRQAEGVPPVVEIEEAPPDLFAPCRVGIQSLALGSPEERSTPSDDMPRHGCKGMAGLRQSARCDLISGPAPEAGPAPARPTTIGATP